MNPPAFPSFNDWISARPRWHGWLQLSQERAYAHAEENYDQQYGVVAPEPEDGEGLCSLINTHGIDTSGPALEIGCGTGRLTYGLVRHYPGPDLLITDPSPTFLRLTQGHLGDPSQHSTRAQYAVLNADDLGQLPNGMFSLIAMRSTLHHILKVEEFIAACAHTLRPGGALAMGAEPSETGYILMAAVAHSILPTLRAAGVEIRPEWEQQLQGFTDTVKFYCRRDIDKAKAEDKHLFQPQEMAETGYKYGLQLRYFPNAAFADYAPPYVPEFVGFENFFMNYLRYCMQFDLAFLRLIRRHLKPQFRYFDECYRSHVGPAITGVFLLKKTGNPA